MLTSEIISAQQIVRVDADSLWAVFMDFERCKARSLGMATDLSLKNEIIAEKDVQILSLEWAVKSYQDVIVPSLEDKFQLQHGLTRVAERKSRKRFFTGVAVGVAGVGIAALFFGGL